MSWLDVYTTELDNIDSFEYYVNKEEPAKICFGSCRDRNLALNKLKSSTSPEIGPGKYFTEGSCINELLDKNVGPRGIGSMAFTSKRLTTAAAENVSPAPNYYEFRDKWKTPKICFVPFNKGTRARYNVVSTVPGVGTYELTKERCRRLKKSSNFGHPTMVHAVEILCRPFGYDECGKCKKLIENNMEYWHKKYINYLCMKCMSSEKDLHQIYTATELKQFKKVKHCSFMHKHEGTLVALTTLPEKAVRKFQNVENYMSLYHHIGNEKRDGPNREKIKCI